MFQLYLKYISNILWKYTSSIFEVYILKVYFTLVRVNTNKIYLNSGKMEVIIFTCKGSFKLKLKLCGKKLFTSNSTDYLKVILRAYTGTSIPALLKVHDLRLVKAKFTIILIKLK